MPRQAPIVPTTYSCCHQLPSPPATLPPLRASIPYRHHAQHATLLPCAQPGCAPQSTAAAINRTTPCSRPRLRAVNRPASLHANRCLPFAAVCRGRSPIRGDIGNCHVVKGRPERGGGGGGEPGGSGGGVLFALRIGTHRDIIQPRIHSGLIGGGGFNTCQLLVMLLICCLLVLLRFRRLLLLLLPLRLALPLFAAEHGA